MNRFNFRESIKNTISRLRGHNDDLQLKGFFTTVEHWRDGKCINTYAFPNAIKNLAKNSLFDTMFNAATQVAAINWCVGLIDNASYSSDPVGDTMASHAGWIEFTAYSQSARVAWGQGSASGQAIVNAAAAVFDITASTGNIFGIFITSNTTKGGTTGLLWTTGAFTSVVPVVNGDQIKVIYQVAA